jgi:hypothetical protein
MNFTFQSAILQQLGQILARLSRSSHSLNGTPNSKRLKARHLVPEHILLWDDANRSWGGSVATPVILERHAPSISSKETTQDRQDSRLSSSVGTEENEDTVSRDGQRQVFDGHHILRRFKRPEAWSRKCLVQVSDLDRISLANGHLVFASCPSPREPTLAWLAVFRSVSTSLPQDGQTRIEKDVDNSDQE